VITSRRGRARVINGTGQVVPLAADQVDRFRLEPAADGWTLRHAFLDGQALTGAPATQALRALMTARNYRGATRHDVDRSVSFLSEIGDPGQLVARVARASVKTGIVDLPPDIACALEIALNQDVERQALDGELTALQEEWVLAEEIANIADNMFLPEGVLERHRALKGFVQ
jgi:hypothetical protein